MITLRQVEAFKAVMEAGTVLRAAEIMHLSQPAVSRLLSDLEAGLGYPLFERRKGRLTPRTEARELYAEVDRAFVGLGQIAEAAERIGSQQTTHLRVAALPMLSSGAFADVIARFLDDNPGVFLSLLARSRREIAEGLLKGRYDLGLTSTPVDLPELTSESLALDEYLCLVPEGHPLSRLEVIRPCDLDGVDFVSAADRTPTWYKLEQALSKQGYRRRIRIETSTAQMVVALVAEGVGVGLTSKLLAQRLPPGRLRAIPMEPTITAELVVLYLKVKSPTGVARRFVDALRSVMERP